MRLVERGPRLFQVTDEGVALFDSTKSQLAEIKEAGHALAGGFARPSGRLRISAPTLFTDLHLGPIAAAFAGRYPDVMLEVVSENRIVDPFWSGFDAVIRVNPDRNEDMVGRLLYRDEILLVAPGPCPQSVLEEMHIPAVLLTAKAERRWTVEGAAGRRVFVPVPVLRLTSIPAARQAILAGAGAAMLPRSAIAADLTEGRLTCWGKSSDRRVELWVLYRSRRLRSPKLSVFVEFLLASFASHRTV